MTTPNIRARLEKIRLDVRSWDNDKHRLGDWQQAQLSETEFLLDALEKALEVLEEYARPMHVTEWDGGHKARTLLQELTKPSPPASDPAT